MEFEEGPTGYPGFRVVRPGPLRELPFTLKRVAWAKLNGIRFFSADVDGESHFFEPWLTVFVEERHRMRLVGVYRTDEDAPDDRSDEPRLCLRRSEWDGSADIDRAQNADDLRSYLATGPQITDRFVFTTRVRHPRIAELTESALAALAGGVAVVPKSRRGSEWHYLKAFLADDRIRATFAYDPAVARSHVLESALESWLPAMEELAAVDGLPPDGPIRISIEHSVVEIVNAPLWVPRPSRGTPATS